MSAKPVVNVSVLGLARNCAATLPGAINQLQAWKRYGIATRLIVGEDGSDDNTREILTTANAELVDTAPPRGANLPRLERLARARELVRLRYAAGRERSAAVLVVDLDEPFLESLSPDLVIRLIGNLQRGGDFAISATSRPYYDLLAFECESKSFVNIGYDIARAQRRPLTYFRFMKSHVYGAQASLTSDEPIRCISAFNGACFYTDYAYRMASYLSKDETKTQICEHVVFNRQIALMSGQRMIVCPDFLLPSPVEHISKSWWEFHRQMIRKSIARLGKGS